MALARRRLSTIFCVGWPSPSSSQYWLGYSYGELRIGFSKNRLSNPAATRASSTDEIRKSLPARGRSDTLEPTSATYRPEDFPGCESFHLPAREVDLHDGRLEFWDARTETAWKACDVSIQHEQPSRRLVQMAERVAALRGSPIRCFGSSALVRLDERRRRRWLMEADEVLYLHAPWLRFQGPSINVDEDPLPDVVLEVDHTTDVRRRKLGIYMECGFPEIRVLVPWATSRRERGFTVHVRGENGYREAPESAAFPGWKAEEIRLALTEDPLSGKAWRALERVALAMGAREGKGPENDPLLRSMSRRAESRGEARGHVEAVTAALRARGIEITDAFAADREFLAGHPIETLMAAALACTGESDFRRRLREETGPKP